MENAGVAPTAQKLYTRVLTVQDLTVKTDRKGRPYANFRGAFTDRTTGKPVSIFVQALGSAYQRVKDHLIEGHEIRVIGAHEQRQADPKNGILPTRSFRIIKLAEPKAKELVPTTSSPDPAESRDEPMASRPTAETPIQPEGPTSNGRQAAPLAVDNGFPVPPPASPDMFD